MRSDLIVADGSLERSILRHRAHTSCVFYALFVCKLVTEHKMYVIFICLLDRLYTKRKPCPSFQHISRIVQYGR